MPQVLSKEVGKISLIFRGDNSNCESPGRKVTSETTLGRTGLLRAGFLLHGPEVPGAGGGLAGLSPVSGRWV